jgi:hypothetical protein
MSKITGAARLVALLVSGVFVAVASIEGCSGGDSTHGSGTDGGAEDATGAESGRADAPASNDTGTDAGAVDALSGGDGGLEAGQDGGREAGQEAGQDAGHEAGLDAAAASSDASGDASGDAASVDGGGDGGEDAGICSTDPFDAGTQVISDPGFENGGDPRWGAVYGGIFSVTTKAHCGTHSGEVWYRAQSYQGLTYSLANIAFPNTYSFSGYVYQDGASSLQMAVQVTAICGDSGSQYFNIALPTVQANTWTHVSGSVTVPGPCTNLLMQIFQNGAPASDAGPAFPNLYVDDAFLNVH